jgi:2-polyprenyl-3-methyl-5-hydroxy-6-metoxy-1,4-benzoquinol methylase
VTADQRLAQPDVLTYWDSRHKAKGDLQSGGDLGYDHPNNEIFYAMRVGRLIDAVGDIGEPLGPVRVLDAGCGKGYFARAMGRFGHVVDGIDASPQAIGQCRDQGGPLENYAVSQLDQWAPPYLYDVVYCIDVLFHVTEDSLWERSVRNLASLVRTGGRIALVDHETDADRLWGNYMITRAASRYVGLLTQLGFDYEQFIPYRFRTSPAGFHVATRTA